MKLKSPSRTWCPWECTTPSKADASCCHHSHHEVNRNPTTGTWLCSCHYFCGLLPLRRESGHSATGDVKEASGVVPVPPLSSRASRLTCFSSGISSQRLLNPCWLYVLDPVRRQLQIQQHVWRTPFIPEQEGPCFQLSLQAFHNVQVSDVFERCGVFLYLNL